MSKTIELGRKELLILHALVGKMIFPGESSFKLYSKLGRVLGFEGEKDGGFNAAIKELGVSLQVAPVFVVQQTLDDDANYARLIVS